MKLVGSLIPVFGGFLYYVGRRFTESYYETLGVPHEALNFSVADYLFRSMQSWMFLIAIALTYLVFLLWQRVLRNPETPLEVHGKIPRKGSESRWAKFRKLITVVFRPKKGDPQYVMLGYFFYFVLAIVLVVVVILPTAQSNFAVEALVGIVVVSPLVTGWFVMTDRPTIALIRAKKRVMALFVMSIAIAVVLSMQLLPHGIGRFVGILRASPSSIEQAFPSVTVISDRPLWDEDIGWVQQDDMYVSQGRLIQILRNNDGVFVKRVIEEETSEALNMQSVSETFYIPDSEIEGLKIDMPGRLPSADDK